MTELRNAFTNDQLKSHSYTYEMLSDRYDDMMVDNPEQKVSESDWYE